MHFATILFSFPLPLVLSLTYNQEKPKCCLVTASTKDFDPESGYDAFNKITADLCTNVIFSNPYHLRPPCIDAHTNAWYAVCDNANCIANSGGEDKVHFDCHENGECKTCPNDP